MKKIVSLLLMALALNTATAFAQSHSVVYDAKVLDSKVLGEQRKYSVYLPAGYNESQRSYPILYLLHPAGPAGTVPNQQSWLYYGELQQYLDQAIASGEITPMIVVTPDANFGTIRRSYYNDADGKFNFEQFFFEEFIPYIEKTYRVRPEKASRAIAGASAGGGGAINYALHHPDMFAVCCGLSAAVRPWADANMKNRYPDVSENKLKEWYKQYDAFEQFGNQDDKAKNQYLLYLSCGDKDGLSVHYGNLHALLNKTGYKHELRIEEGAHDWTYWRSITPDFMSYISKAFRK